MKTNTAPRRAYQSGVGLVELMIAITLALVISAALIQAFLASKTTYRFQDALAAVQENGRFAVNYLTREIRMAGYIGCPMLDRLNPTINNLLSSTPADLQGFGPNQIVRSGEAKNFTTLAPGAVDGTEVLVVRKASGVGAQLSSALSAASDEIVLAGNPAKVVAGDVLVISDCFRADLFRASDVSGTTTVTIGHTTGNTSGNLSKGYGTDAEVMAMQSVAFFITDTGRKTDRGNPIRALSMRLRDAGQGSAALVSTELVDGVEDMHVEFGVDTDADQAVDSYKKAGDIDAADWSKVIAVRISLLLQSTDDRVVGSDGPFAQDLKFKGADVASDGRLRQIFATVVAIRNRLP